MKLQTTSEEGTSVQRSTSFHIDPEPTPPEGDGPIDSTAELRVEPEGDETTAELHTAESEEGLWQEIKVIALVISHLNALLHVSRGLHF